MLELVALAAAIAAAYALAAFGQIKPERRVIVPAPATARRRQRRR